MPDIFDDACEEIDAAFFSGDAFHDNEALTKIKHYLGRWNREAESIEKMLKDIEEENEK